jgi:hypothetical protein
MSTGMEKKEIDNSADIFWSREPIMGHRGTKENPAIVPSYNTSRCVGLETEQVRGCTHATPHRPFCARSHATAVAARRAPDDAAPTLGRGCRSLRSEKAWNGAGRGCPNRSPMLHRAHQWIVASVGRLTFFF